MQDQELFNKIEQLRDLLKALASKPKVSQPSMVPALKPPTIKPVSISSTAGSAPTKIPGIEPPSGKDPAKVAQQLKNPKPKKPKMEILKADRNGQWSLDKV